MVSEVNVEGPRCCRRCPGLRCPEWIKDKPPPPPFKLSDQLKPHNTQIPPSVLKWSVADGEVHTGVQAHNSPLMIAFEAGLRVSSLVGQGARMRDIEIWMEEISQDDPIGNDELWAAEQRRLAKLESSRG